MCVTGQDAMGLAGDPASPVHRLDPRAKVVGLLGLTVVAVTVPLWAWPAWLACVAALASVAVAARVPARTIWRRARVVLPLVLLVAATLPFVRHGGARIDLGPVTVSEDGLAVLAGVAAKAAIGTVSAVLLAATTAFPAVLRALEALRVPALLVLVAGVTYRYLFVVAGQAQRMRTAMTARGYRPRHALQAGALGRAATALFLRTHSRGERVHVAMVARGYAGRMPALDVLVLRRVDAAFAAAVAGGPLLALVALEVLR